MSESPLVPIFNHKRCPHCGGHRWHRLGDVTLHVAYDTQGRLCDPEISDLGTSHYVPVCVKCDRPSEKSEMVDP